MNKSATYRPRMSTLLTTVLMLCLFMLSTTAIAAPPVPAEKAEPTEQAEPDRMADDFVVASLIVAEPGGVLYSILGHACLHLRCDYYDIDLVYTYESEEVEGKVLRFLANKLRMGMFYFPPQDYLDDFREQGRGVREYELRLPPEVETELWRLLDDKVAEGYNLEYDYIKRGCTIAVVHCVEQAISAANKLYGTDYEIVYPAWGDAFDRTLREIVYDNSPEGWQRFYGMTLVGGQVDNPKLPKKEKLIIPRELLATWQQATINGQPIISEGEELLPIVNEYKGDSFTPLHASLIVLLLALVSLFWKRWYIDGLMLILQTALGCLMLWLLLSPLPGSEWSWLIIPFNPLPALLWKWRKSWGLYFAIAVVLWCVAMMMSPHRLVENAHIIFALACALTWFKQSQVYIYHIKPLITERL